ncbi:MAG TPA: PAS domain S-box protein [Pseudomonas sp.]|nr:PAS domain S-box protein [Pseudomonas sp.]
MQTRHLIIAAYLHVLAFAMLGMGAISLLGYLQLAQPSLHNIVLLPDSAIMSMLMGGLILAATRRAMAAARLLTALLVALMLYSLLHNQLAGGADIGQSWLSGFTRMRSVLALCMLVASVGLYLSLTARGKGYAQLIGGLLVLLALLAQLADSWAPLQRLNLGFKYSATHVANLFTLCLGLATILLARRPHGEHGLLDRRTLLAGLVATLLACSSWYLLSRQAIQSISRDSELLLNKMALATSADVHKHLALLKRMTERWQNLGGMPSASFWQQEARSFLRDFPNLQAIAILDQHLAPPRLEARTPAQALWLQSFLTDDAEQAWLQQARSGTQAQLSHTRSVAEDGGRNALLAHPLHLPGQAPALLVASLNISAELNNLLSTELSGFVVLAHEGEHLLYNSSPQPPRFSTPVSQHSLLLPHGQTWQLNAYLDSPKALQGAKHLASLTLLFGLALSFFLMLSQRLAWLATAHARQLEQANLELQTSLAQQLRMHNLNQRIMQFTLDVLCSIDHQGRFQELSPSCEKLFGYTQQELLGRALIDLVIAEDRPHTREQIAACMQSGVNPPLRNRCRHRNGRILHVLWSVDWSAEAHSLFAVAHDITPLLEHEAQVESQREILSMISNDRPLTETLEALCLMVEGLQPGALCSVLLLDPSGTHLRTGAAPNLPAAYNQAIDGAAIGPDVGSCGTAAFRRQLVISPDISRDPLWQGFRELALAHGLKACWSFPLVSHNGQGLGTFGIYYRQPQSPDDEQIQHLATAAQLAAIAIARAADRRELEESRQRFRSLFSFNPDMVFACDLQGQLLSINDAGQRLLGLRQAELLGQHFSSLVAAEQQEQVLQHFAAACAGAAQRYSMSLAQGAQPLSLDVSMLPIMVDGQIVGVFAIAKDISEQRQTQAKLQATLQELERSNQELQDFAFVASHDLQEPLRKIQAFSERLTSRASNLDADQRDYLQRMTSAAARMQALINDLLGYSRLSSRAQPLQPQDLNQLLGEVLQDMETALEQSQARIECQTLPAVLGDASQLRQVLQNLLSNALKFQSPGQQPLIRLYMEHADSNGWELCIADNGIGFEEKYLDRIFNPFQRLHGREAYAGTGIGLAIVKKIVERHGARISASSVPGQGSIFRIRFPTLAKVAP